MTAIKQNPVNLPPAGTTGEVGKGIAVGIFGGQGPAAGADAARLFHEAQGSKTTEQEYVPSTLLNDPRIPDRTAFIKDKSAPDPVPVMRSLAEKFNKDDEVKVVFIPCNTAHTFHKLIAGSMNAVLLNMPKATAKHLEQEGLPKGSRVGVMCTDGTIQQGLYTKALQAKGYVPVYPDEEQQKDVMAGIYQGVKVGNTELGTQKMQPVLEHMLTKMNCDRVLLACTEIPLALTETTEGKQKMAKTLNPVVAVSKRALHHVGNMHAAVTRGESRYDFGSDAELSDIEGGDAGKAQRSRIAQSPVQPRDAATAQPSASQVSVQGQFGAAPPQAGRSLRRAAGLPETPAAE